MQPAVALGSNDGVPFSLPNGFRLFASCWGKCKNVKSGASRGLLACRQHSLELESFFFLRDTVHPVFCRTWISLKDNRTCPNSQPRNCAFLFFDSDNLLPCYFPELQFSFLLAFFFEELLFFLRSQNEWRKVVRIVVACSALLDQGLDMQWLSRLRSRCAYTLHHYSDHETAVCDFTLFHAYVRLWGRTWECWQFLNPTAFSESGRILADLIFMWP